MNTDLEQRHQKALPEVDAVSAAFEVGYEVGRMDAPKPDAARRNAQSPADKPRLFHVTDRESALQAVPVWKAAVLDPDTGLRSSRTPAARLRAEVRYLLGIAQHQGVRFVLTDHAAAKALGLPGVDAWQNFVRLLERTGWAVVHRGDSGDPDYAPLRATTYILTLPKAVQEGGQEGGQNRYRKAVKKPSKGGHFK
jgi:hypothetical protein